MLTTSYIRCINRIISTCRTFFGRVNHCFDLRHFVIANFWLALIMFLVPNAKANQILRPLRFEDLPQDTQKTKMVKVLGAEVAWMSREPLVRDFPFLNGYSDDEIRNWILNEFSYVSEAQLLWNGFRQSEFAVDKSDQKDSYRQKHFNRAGELDVKGKQIGLINTKGIGHIGNDLMFFLEYKREAFEQAVRKNDTMKINDVLNERGNNGLMSLGEGAVEIVRQQAAQKLLDIQYSENPGAIKLETTECYFLIRLPFNILRGQTSDVAGILGRQSTVGRNFNFPVSESIYVDEPGGQQWDDFGAAVDFGGVQITSPLLESTFGKTDPTKPNDPQYSPDWQKAHIAAKEYEHGNASAITNYIEQMLEPIRTRWETAKKYSNPLQVYISKLQESPESEREKIIQAMILDTIQGSRERAYAEYLLERTVSYKKLYKCEKIFVNTH